MANDLKCKGCGVVFSGRSRRKFCSHSCALTNGRLALGSIKAGTEPTLHPSTQDIAWAAGIYEGEGSAVYAGGTTIVQVGQVGVWLPQRLRDMFGGRAYQRKTPRLSKQAQYVWVVSGTYARGFLLTIFMFLSPRRKIQALVAMGRA